MKRLCGLLAQRSPNAKALSRKTPSHVEILACLGARNCQQAADAVGRKGWQQRWKRSRATLRAALRGKPRAFRRKPIVQTDDVTFVPAEIEVVG
jgi:hypothetical protein